MSTAILSVTQRMQIQRAVRTNKQRAARDEAGELNVIPFLDIVMNVLMFVLATSTTVFTATITPTAGGCCVRGVVPDVPTLHVTRAGYVVASRSGFVGPDCRSLTSGGQTTIPLRDGRHDAAALTRCLTTLRQAAGPASPFRVQRALQVSTLDNVPYGELVRALDAARETRPGAGDLYPEVSLGVLR